MYAEARRDSNTSRDYSPTPYDEGYPEIYHGRSRQNHPYSSVRNQEPLTPGPRFAAQRQEWATRSLSDMYAESIPETPSAGTPLRPLTPAHSSFFAPERSTTSLADSTNPLFPDAPSGYFTKERIREGQSHIARLHDRDDVGFLPTWKRYLYYAAPVLSVLTLVLYWLYFALRIRFVMSAQEAEHNTFPLAWVFIGVELAVAIPVFLQSFWSIFIMKKRNRPKYRLIGNNVPAVDVFITCCGEEDDLVLDTLRAACDIDYPVDKFRVIVLDDGKSDDLKAGVQDLAHTYPNAMYMRRPKFPGVPHHFKAGNLNYGLDEVHNLPGGAAEYMAALDADMIPERDWLRAILPHLLLDEKMALACPPQLFYNVPAGDPLCQSLDFFVHVSEPIKDALGVAWCTGSGYVVRRAALDEIGNFPLGSLAEDVATSTLMLGLGWKTAYIHEALQYGTVPETFSGHLKQRTRWAIGTVDTSIKLRFMLWGQKIKHLTLAQRTSSFCYAIMSFFNIVLVLSLFAMPVVLISGNRLVAYSNETQLRWLIRACFAAFMSNRLSELALFIPSGYATGQRGSRAQIWMAPYIGLTIIRSFFLPVWLGGQTQAFKPSGSLKSDLNERDPALRAPMHRRLRVILFNNLAAFHLFYVYFCLAAVVLSSYRCVAQNLSSTIATTPTGEKTTPVRAALECLLTHAFWPPLSWILVVSAFWCPITYACDPPNMNSDREHYLDRDPKTGVAHPTKKSKRIGFKTETALFELEYSFTTAFTAVVFVAAFFY